MKQLSILLVDSNLDINVENDQIELIKTTKNELYDAIQNANGKYISFIFDNDFITDNYIDLVYNKSFEEFDCCYINFRINYDMPREIKRIDSFEYLRTIKPYYLDYLWKFMFKTEILRQILSFDFDGSFDSNIDEIIKEESAITEIIYYHNPIKDFELIIDNIPYVNYKKIEFHKNIIYNKLTLNSNFNGIITWFLNMGRMFGGKYEITILYDEILDGTLERLSRYFNMVHREKYVNYFCDRYISTYLDYEIPDNIFYNEECSTFIHGMLINGDCLDGDIYDRYIAVSKACMDTVRFAFETDKKPDYIHNPVKINKKEIKPHLHLVSTLRSEEDKGLSRLEQVATILDEEQIPFTWNVFTDINNGTNHSGFIYRNSVDDTLPYVQDADYLVLLSKYEAFCYSVAEALYLNTKVVITPVDVFSEIGAVDGENAIVIPFEYFNEENKELLREKIKLMYKEKDKKINYEPINLNSYRFEELFNK